MSFAAATALAQAAALLDQAARSSKRIEERQREQARRLRQATELVQQAGHELGVNLIIDTGSEEDPQSWQSKTFSTSAR